MFIITQNDVPSASVHRITKIYVRRKVFSVPKHVKSVLYYVIGLLYTVSQKTTNDIFHQ